MNKLEKMLTVGAISTAGILTMAGSCHNESIKTNKNSEIKYEINDFGRLTIYSGMDRIPINSISSADVDGDGDMDFLVGTALGIYVIESKIPQKGYQKKN